MKQCPKCKLTKSLSEFNKNSSSKDGLQRLCRICVAEQSKKSYDKIPDNYKNRIKKQVQKTIDYVDEYRKHNPCTKCGENRYWLLDFHHTDPSVKEENIGALKRTGSFKKLQTEIKKCIILCKNCHADFHHKERIEKINIDEYIKGS